MTLKIDKSPYRPKFRLLEETREGSEKPLLSVISYELNYTFYIGNTCRKTLAWQRTIENAFSCSIILLWTGK